MAAILKIKKSQYLSNSFDCFQLKFSMVAVVRVAHKMIVMNNIGKLKAAQEWAILHWQSHH